ncbi:MAG: type II toxin-antitoxin system VapC family toxin [Thermoplasmatota archaeon]
MIYLDSNVFICAALYDDATGEYARDIIKRVRCGEFRASTSTLTFDEVYWIVKREKGKEAALKIINAFLHMRNLDFIAVDKELLFATYELLEDRDLDPRDSIHLACAIESRASILVSEDSDFDEIDLIENLTMEIFLKERCS